MYCRFSLILIFYRDGGGREETRKCTGPYHFGETKMKRGKRNREYCKSERKKVKR
jgi:hypothetical protein